MGMYRPMYESHTYQEPPMSMCWWSSLSVCSGEVWAVLVMRFPAALCIMAKCGAKLSV